ncbi:hypothetical protein [Streptomyces sp. NRRL WC-3549]|uniref:hypothetical protein n=1 Tax=Streptomyces sp. NRRL WC-3549 TaxID=1463925 RepID=UPI00131D08D2|nr:hypothetical protein [Streptomyces sp. NRRL WC-3549]
MCINWGLCIMKVLTGALAAFAFSVLLVAGNFSAGSSVELAASGDQSTVAPIAVDGRPHRLAVGAQVRSRLAD